MCDARGTRIAEGGVHVVYLCISVCSGGTGLVLLGM